MEAQRASPSQTVASASALPQISIPVPVESSREIARPINRYCFAPAEFLRPISIETKREMEVWMPAAVTAKPRAVTGAIS